ncbi:hypothetical protein GCM10010228_58830 [Streptomyces massasporeus]|nr:hypothetical protein GCM10010228_58830 [Streptomyces massasporeus]
MSEADLSVDSGQTLLDLGDTGRAHQLITDGERLLPAARDKTRGVFLAYRAASYLDQKEPEPAAAAATQSLLLARRIGAPRCVRLIEALIPRFQPYDRAPGVPDSCSAAPPRRRGRAGRDRPAAATGQGSSHPSAPSQRARTGRDRPCPDLRRTTAPMRSSPCP